MKDSEVLFRSRVSQLRGALDRYCDDMEIELADLARFLEIDNVGILKEIRKGIVFDDGPTRMALQKLYWMACIREADGLLLFGTEQEDVASWPAANMRQILEKRRQLDERRYVQNNSHLIINAIGISVAALMLASLFIFMVVGLQQTSAPRWWTAAFIGFLILPVICLGVAYNYFREWRAYRRTMKT